MKKTIIVAALIIAIAAICITMIICGNPGYALAILGIIAACIIVIAPIYLLFKFFTN